MLINQLSIFLENRAGTLIKVLDIMKKNGFQLFAFTIADSAEFGILRVISPDAQAACRKLSEEGLAVAMNHVFAIEFDNEPGSAADAIKLFSDAGLSILYMYTFLFHGKGVSVFRIDDVAAAEEVLRRSGLKCITQEELCSYQ